MSSKTVHILLVDDDDVDVMAVKRAFRKHRIANPITVARDGIEALAMLREEDGYPSVPRPFIILLDINMPRMNGLQFLEELRGDPAIEDSVIFVLTTSRHDEDRIAAYKRHVAGYIVKTDIGNGFMKLVEMLDSYWRVVELP
ncbi:MAG: response regulator [Myxococcota bacterium]